MDIHDHRFARTLISFRNSLLLDVFINGGHGIVDGARAFCLEYVNTLPDGDVH